MSNPLDGPDAQFDAAVVAFGAWLVANFASTGLSAAQNTAIQNAVTAWITAYAAHGPAQAAATLAQFEKDNARAILTELMREPAKKITDPAERAAAGLNVYAERRGRVPVPTTRPLLMVDTSQRFRHIIKFSDETSPNSKGKPDGVRHLEIWWCVNPTPPSGHAACEFLATDTNTPYTNEIEAEHTGKMVHYMARWVNSRGETGPWSETVSATVTG